MAGKGIIVPSILGGVIAAALTVAGAGPALAGVPVGDVGIRGSAPPGGSTDPTDFFGNGVYTETGEGQTIKKTMHAGQDRMFAWMWGNDGDTGDLTVKATGNKPCFKTRHLIKDVAGSDITDFVIQGVTNSVGAGSNGGDWIALHIKAKSCADPGDRFKVKIDVSPSGDGQSRDRAKAKVKVT